MATNEDLRKLKLLQKLKIPRRTPIRWMLETLRLTLVLVFKMKNEMVPNYMQYEILFTRDATARTLRNADDFKLPRYQKTSMIWYNDFFLILYFGRKRNPFKVLPFFYLI
jgi:hypothetical protein